jgi:hypothetical protein
MAIQPADCGHQNDFWSTGVRVRPCRLFHRSPSMSWCLSGCDNNTNTSLRGEWVCIFCMHFMISYRLCRFQICIVVSLIYVCLSSFWFRLFICACFVWAPRLIWARWADGAMRIRRIIGCIGCSSPIGSLQACVAVGLQLRRLPGSLAKNHSCSH